GEIRLDQQRAGQVHAREISVGEVGLAQDGVPDLSASHIAAGQVRVAHVAAHDTGASHVGAGQRSSVKRAGDERRLTEACSLEPGTNLDIIEVGLAQVSAVESGFPKISEGDLGANQLGASEVGPMEGDAREVD